MADFDIKKETADQPEERGTNLEDAFQDLFKTSASGSGEEELLKIASKFSRQITTRQIQLLLYLEDKAIRLEKNNPVSARRIHNFIERWLELKQYNNSDMFVMKALEFISLRKFINENTMKVNIDK